MAIDHKSIAMKKKLNCRIALTAGEPAGIGPDIIIQLAQQPFPAELVVVADPDLLQQRAKQLNLPLTLIPVDFGQAPQPHTPQQLKILPVMLDAPVVIGKLNTANAKYVLKTLEVAAEHCLKNNFQALVTAPVHKGIINDAGIAFSGHTEFLAHFTHAKNVVMMLVAKNLRVALVTTHLPLAQVPAAITKEKIIQTLQIIQHDLQHYFAIAKPKILVAALNPHAGEGGHLGREEIEIITPTLEEMRRHGMDVIGPLPADTLFIPKYLNQADVFVAMYHDQGLPVIKYHGFGEVVNVTLGLPIIRTSVDHGTALELAGTGQADASSLQAALELAFNMVTSLELQ